MGKFNGLTVLDFHNSVGNFLPCIYVYFRCCFLKEASFSLADGGVSEEVVHLALVFVIEICEVVDGSLNKFLLTAFYDFVYFLGQNSVSWK